MNYFISILFILSGGIIVCDYLIKVVQKKETTGHTVKLTGGAFALLILGVFYLISLLTS